MTHSRFDAVLFDLDGLLVDTEAVFHAVDLDLLTGQGVPPARAAAVLDEMIGQDEVTCRALIARSFPTLDLEALDRDRAHGIEAAFAKGIPLRPNVVALLDRLQAIDMPMAVATNSSHARALYKLQITGLAERFDVVVGFDMVPDPKPAPDVYRRAAQDLGRDPGRCVAFEDSDTGARAARAAGCFVVQVPNLQATDGRWADLVCPDVLSGAQQAGILPAAQEA